MNYTITLTETEDKALAYAALSQQDWIDNVVHNRCRIAIDEIVKVAVDNFLAAGDQCLVIKMKLLILHLNEDG